MLHIHTICYILNRLNELKKCYCLIIIATVNGVRSCSTSFFI